MNPKFKDRAMVYTGRPIRIPSDLGLVSLTTGAHVLPKETFQMLGERMVRVALEDRPYVITALRISEIKFN